METWWTLEKWVDDAWQPFPGDYPTFQEVQGAYKFLDAEQPNVWRIIRWEQY